jgi:hypothetical protein
MNMRYNEDGSVNIEETYDGNRRFTKEEYIFLWHLFLKEDPEMFNELRGIQGFCPVESFLEFASKEFYDSKRSLK